MATIDLTTNGRAFSIRAEQVSDLSGDSWIAQIAERFPHRNESAAWEGDVVGHETAAIALSEGVRLIIETIADEED